MKNLFFLVLLNAFLFNAVHAETLPDCGAASKIGDECTLPILEIKPTQFSVGMIAVGKKIEKLQSMSAKKLAEYLSENPVTVVKRISDPESCERNPAPGPTFYMIDQHHLSRALLELNHSAVRAKVIAEVMANDDDSFWWVMKQKNFVYLKDRNGNTRSPLELPNKISNVADDPWRSLAGEMEDQGMICKKDGIYYFEFIWADFLRTRIPEILIKSDFEAAVQSAAALVDSPDARSLPGACTKQLKTRDN